MEKKNPYKNFLNFGTLKSGIKKKIWEDLYYYLVRTSWPTLLSILFLTYFISNLFFAGIYYTIPKSINNMDASFMDSFFFSVQAMATIGFGGLSPTGILTNFIVTIEAFIGLITVSLTTGLVFSKLYKPHAKIRFSKYALINNFNGKKKFVFRMGNIRGNDLIEAKVNVSALIDEITEEGINIRRIKDLNLERNFTPFFNLTWMVFHPIDSSSPFYHIPLDDPRFKAIVITLTGHDGTFSNTIYGRHIYTSDLIIQNKYYEDVMFDLDDRIHVNYDNFDLLKD